MADEIDPKILYLMQNDAMRHKMEHVYQREKAKSPSVLLLFKVGETYTLIHHDAMYAGLTTDLTIMQGDSGMMLVRFAHPDLRKHLSEMSDNPAFHTLYLTASIVKIKEDANVIITRPS